MKFNAALLFTGLSILSFNTLAFGPTGHRVVGQICQNNLTAKAESALSQIMGLERLAYAATWPDDMRSSPTDKTFWKGAAKWHFVNVPDNTTYANSSKNSEGDLIVAVGELSRILKNEPLKEGPVKTNLKRYFGDLQAPENQLKLKQFAVRFIIHIIGDLHQPLHAGFKSDRGGNTIEVEYFGETEKLHRVWDSSLIDGQKLSFTELADKLDTIKPQEKKAIQASGLMDWLQESLKLRHIAYNVDKYDSKFSYSYVYDNAPIVNAQMQKAGLRAAKLFNQLFN